MDHFEREQIKKAKYKLSLCRSLADETSSLTNGHFKNVDPEEWLRANYNKISLYTQAIYTLADEAMEDLESATDIELAVTIEDNELRELLLSSDLATFEKVKQILKDSKSPTLNNNNDGSATS